MKTFDFVIIGGGAAGMAASIACKERSESSKVLILEKKSELGKKILATGNGRCNVSNSNYKNYHILKKFFDDLGLLLKEEAEGRLYPYSESAKDVRDLVALKLRNLGVEVYLNSEVTQLEINENGNFCIYYKNDGKNTKVLLAKNVLLATGGKAAPQYGSTGDGYVLAKRMGHSLTKLRPVLTSFICKEDIKQLKGVRASAKLTLLNKVSGEMQMEEGEVQFTDYGISGICIFNLSRHVLLKDLEKRSRQEAFSDYALFLDFMPEYEKKELRALISDRLASINEEDFSYLLTGFVPNKLADYIIHSNLIVLKKDGKIEFLKTIVEMLKSMELGISELRGWNYAQCTGGGITSSEISGETFESNLVSGLYFAGEILDYDDICGGYNLSNAFFSGICVGSKVGRCIELDKLN